MIAYHCDSNAMLIAPFNSCKDSHQLLAYNEITTQLKKLGQLVDLHILDNKDSAEYKKTMREVWKVDYQIVPPNIHLLNEAKRAIRTFKAHFLAILAGIAEYPPQNLWNLSTPQTEMTLNLLQQSTLKSATSV